MEFLSLLQNWSNAVADGDGAGFAALFSEDGQYDDVFYGRFMGRTQIADMLENRFHRDASDFVWEMIDPVATDTVGYARWRFSYTSKLPHIAGKRILMDGAGYFQLSGGLVRHYEDVAKIGEVLQQLEFPAAKQHRLLQKMTETQRLQFDPYLHLIAQEKSVS